MIQKSMGTTISCTVNSSPVLIGALRAIREIHADSEAVDITTLDATDGCRVYAQGLKDMGEVTLEGFYEPTNQGQTALRTLYASGAAVPFTVTFPDASALSFNAFVKSHAVGAASVDGAVGFTAVLRLTGGVTAS